MYLVVLRKLFNPTYKQKKQVKKYIWDLYQRLVLFLQIRNYFCYVPGNDIEGEILVWTTPERVFFQINIEA